jgi:hypothetical protein
MVTNDKNQSTQILQFDKVYSDEISNEEFFENSISSYVDKCFEGFNVTIFAYGHTGAGKTYTI